MKDDETRFAPLGELKPKDHAEEVALFRAEMIGALVHRHFEERGELKTELLNLSKLWVRPPGARLRRTYSFPTLERWYYAHRDGGLDALKPQPRSDKGHARELTDAQKELLGDIRREHPSAGATLILRTLIKDGRLQEGVITASTVRRFYEEQGLTRARRRDHDGRQRRRWEAARPMALWHADVCHGPALLVGKRRLPLRIHAILDDASRYVVALRAVHTERESEMLALSVQAFCRYGRPLSYYFDNGPTYVGEALATMCGRLHIGLRHASPYDPQARGKMERFWRTMREQCLDHVGTRSSLHDVQVRLLAWLDQHYHRAPHGGLMGKTPLEVFERERPEPDVPDQRELRDALTVRARRRVLSDGTLSVGGVTWELTQSYLAAKLVTVARSLLEPDEAPWVEHEGKRLDLCRVDPKANASRKRNHTKRMRTGIDAVPFEPAEALLDEATGRAPYHLRGDNEEGEQ